VRRGDHWVRYLELAVGSLFWWHPVVWWSRHRLRQAEERSCDDWVLRALPDHSRAYAGGLLKTVEFLAGSDSRLPSLASGAADADNLKERLTMILKNVAPRKLTRTQLVLLGVVALALLVVFPTRADRSNDSTPEGKGYISEERALNLERRVEELQRQLALLHDRRMEHEMAQTAERMGTEYDQALVQMQREMEDQQAARNDLHRELEQRLFRALQMAEQEQHDGDLDTARRLQEQARAIKMELSEASSQMEHAQVEFGRAMFLAEQDRIRGEVERLRANGRTREAQLLENELEAVERARREQRIQELLSEVERLRAEQQHEGNAR
jgi:hypothetical protein